MGLISKVVKWTPEEIAIVKREYSERGAVALVPMLPGRSVYAIKQKANEHGLKCLHRKHTKPRRAAKPSKHRAYRPAYVKPKYSDEFNAWRGPVSPFSVFAPRLHA